MRALTVALLLSAATIVSAAADTSYGMRARTGSTTCAPTIEEWLQTYGKAVLERPVERTTDVLASDVEWTTGERQRIVVARRGADGFCVVLSGPIPSV